MKLAKIGTCVQRYALLFFVYEIIICTSSSAQAVSSSSSSAIPTSLSATPMTSPILLTFPETTPTSISPSSISAASSSISSSPLPMTHVASLGIVSIVTSSTESNSPFMDVTSNVCSNQSVIQKCINSFRNLYAFSPNDTGADAFLLGKLACVNYTSKPNDSCISEVLAKNCTIIRAALSDNRTSFGVLCTSSGELKQFDWTSMTCQNETSSFIRNIIDTTEVFCSSAINGSFICNKTSSGFQVMSKSGLLNTLLAKNACPAPATTPIPLLPNPVGPAAMTAIVVLTVIGIICILAGFFFWPKCHISEDEVRLAEKKKRLKKKGKLNSAYAYSDVRPPTAPYSAKFGGAKYEVEHGSVAVQAPRVPTTTGPPAA